MKIKKLFTGILICILFMAGILVDNVYSVYATTKNTAVILTKQEKNAFKKIIHNQSQLIPINYENYCKARDNNGNLNKGYTEYYQFGIFDLGDKNVLVLEGNEGTAGHDFYKVYYLKDGKLKSKVYDGEYKGVIRAYQIDEKALFMECGEMPFEISLLKIKSGKPARCHRLHQQFGVEGDMFSERTYNDKKINRKQYISYLDKYYEGHCYDINMLNISKKNEKKIKSGINCVSSKKSNMAYLYEFN